MLNDLSVQEIHEYIDDIPAKLEMSRVPCTVTCIKRADDESDFQSWLRRLNETVPSQHPREVDAPQSEQKKSIDN